VTGEAGGGDPARRPPVTATAPHLGVSLLNFARAGPPEAAADLAAALVRRAVVADRAGIDRVTVVDHVVMGDRIDAYDGERFPTGPDGMWLEPLTLLSAVAATTHRVRLATGILVAPLRRAPALAKAVATLDVLSRGRVDLGVGVGWQREEYDASGVPFARRGDELDRTVEACRRLWRGEAVLPDVAADGSTATAGAPVWCEPRPLQAGGVPIWFGGRLHARTLRRIVRLGDGWIPWGEHQRDVAPGIARVRAALEQAGRDPAGLAVVGSLPLVRGSDGGVAADPTVAAVPDLAAAGVTAFSLQGRLAADDELAGDQLATLVAAFDRVTGRTPVAP
jgi:probable F420-dependent oxidoreductase